MTKSASTLFFGILFLLGCKTRELRSTIDNQEPKLSEDIEANSTDQITKSSKIFIDLEQFPATTGFKKFTANLRIGMTPSQVKEILGSPLGAGEYLEGHIPDGYESNIMTVWFYETGEKEKSIKTYAILRFTPINGSLRLLDWNCHAQFQSP